jgi:hypothetical protein
MTVSSQSGIALEPNLAEMLEDPIVQMVLRRDGIVEDDVLRVTYDAAQRLSAKQAA